MARIIATIINDVNYDQRMQRICATLAEQGHEVTMVGRERYFSTPLSDRPYRQVRFKCWFNRGKLFYLEYNLRLLLFLFRHPFDIVCSVDMDTLLPGYLVAQLKRKSCVYDAHEYFSEVPELTHRPLTRNVWSWLEKRLIPRIQNKYTVNQCLADLFQAELNSSFSVIRNVPYLQSSSKEQPSTDKEPFLLYQGVLNVGRGLDTLLYAVAQLDVSLYLAGEGDITDELKVLTKKLGIEERVQFLGFVAPDELRKLMLQATVGINLIEPQGISYYCSLANKFFDYIHAELPQITMNYPEYRHINEHYEVGVLLDTLRPDQVRKAIQQLLQDRDYYNKLVNNCRQAKQKYNWQKESDKLVRFYNKIVPSG